MARGRPRSKTLRARDTDGTLKYHQNKKQTEKQIVAVALNTRLKYAKPHHARRIESATLFGMLMLEGYLTPLQYEASVRLALTFDKYRKSQGLGVEHIRSVALGSVFSTSQSYEDSPEYIEKIKAEYTEALALILSISQNIKVDGYYTVFKGILREQVTLAHNWPQYTSQYELKNIIERLERLIIFYKIR